MPERDPPLRSGLYDQQVGDAIEVPAGGPEQVLVGGGPPQVEVQVVLPRVADAAVDLGAVLEDPPGRLAGGGLGRRGRRGCGRAPAASTVIAAYCTAEVARSSASDMSASLCWIAWKEPIGRSNCSRSFAYASDMSKIRRAVPTISAAIDT